MEIFAVIGKLLIEAAIALFIQWALRKLLALMDLIASKLQSAVVIAN